MVRSSEILICGPSVWNFLLAPRILRWLIDFLENLCSPGLIVCLKLLVMETEAYTRKRSFLAVKEQFVLPQ